MEDIIDELGIPRKYTKFINKESFTVSVQKIWLRDLLKTKKLGQFPEKAIIGDLDSNIVKVFIRVLRKKDAKVIPLPRIRNLNNDNENLTFCQLIQYIQQTNFKNLWKDAFKKFYGFDFNKDIPITLVDYNDVLKEIIVRIYGCPIIGDPNIERSKTFETPLNISNVICGIETPSAIFLIHYPCLDHNLRDCVTFSPAILEKHHTKPLFLVYQLLQTFKNLHDRSLTLGDVSLNDIYLTEDMWLNIVPAIHSNIHIQELPKFEPNCHNNGHKFDSTTLKCEYCNIKTYDKVQVYKENLEQLCKLWIDGQISNFTYLSVLNKLSGRKYGDPNCHYVFPWVTDFSSRCGKNWRDLKKSKYRLNKGDRQLDLTYDNSQFAHHVSDVLSSITYYVYMARRTSKSVLCKNVRTIWVPAEYPSSIQRMYEWTPDECIPEFFTDPTVFRSIHDDLDDLDIPSWASSPEDFIEKHREALESQHVSERLHYWIDLTFGYKLSGNAAIKAKNVCLNLVDEHSQLTKSGIVQLFFHPHPPKSTTSIYFSKAPPKIYLNKTIKSKSRDRSSSPSVVADKSDDDEDNNTLKNTLGISRFLSRSRSSLNDEPKRSNQRSTSLGPKNPSFTSHVIPKTKTNNNGIALIPLPKDYKPELALDLLEKKHQFISKTFHPDFCKKCENKSDTETNNDNDEIQNSFTNLYFEKKVFYKTKKNEIVCNYSQIINSRRIQELQVLGCLIVEIYMAKQLRSLGANTLLNFDQRLKTCLTIVKNCKDEVPAAILKLTNLLLQPDGDLKNFKYPPVSDSGLPPPSAHLLLEPMLHSIIAFPKTFPQLYFIIKTLKDFKNIALELDLLYYFECNGGQCLEYENLEKTKIKYAQNIGECKVKSCAKYLEEFLNEINPNTEQGVVEILLPHIRELLEDPPCSVLAAWYLFDPFARIFGPNKSQNYLLESLLKLYENEPNEPFNGKMAKLYHHSFLLRLIVRLGLKTFLENFITPLVEAVGGYKDENIEYIFHTHSEKLIKKTSHLKTMDQEFANENKSPQTQIQHEEIFDFDESDDNLDIIEHLDFEPEEEALDATVPENLDQLRSLEELTLNLDEDKTPTPTSKELLNISCDVGSKYERKRSNSVTSQKSKKSENSKISEISSDSLIWLSHRLGPVLTARYLSRNLLKMLTLCYVGGENLEKADSDYNNGQIIIIDGVVKGDLNAAKVLDCLTSIAGLYGEQLILFQYIPHMTELIVLCQKRLTTNLEGGLISCLALLKHIIPYLSDSTLMNQLQDTIVKCILQPTVQLLASTKSTFPNGQLTRKLLATKYLNAVYVLSVRIGSDMTRAHLLVPVLQSFFSIFDISEEIQVELEEKQNLEQLMTVFTPELAYYSYLPFLKLIGEDCLINFKTVHDLCYKYENDNTIENRPESFNKIINDNNESNVALIGNRIEVKNENLDLDLLSLVSNRMENNSRHLRGNWLAYWEHEIGRSDKDLMFNFKQIKLQTFGGHTHSVKCLSILDNENSFMSGSRDKTVKLWSLRSQGDGSSVSNCQWTYTSHKKSVLSLIFIESSRFAASCDTVVHIWDPFMGANVVQLESPKYPPVNVLKCMPAPSCLFFAATTEGSVKVVDTRMGCYIYDLKISLNPSGLIRCLAVAPSGLWLATGQSSGYITVLDTRTGLVISTWRAHEGEVLQLVAKDNETLISSSLDQNVSVWNVNDGKFKLFMRGATEPVHCLNVYNNELISGTTANRIGVHTSIDIDASFSSTKLRCDAFKGLLTSMALLPLNRLLLLGADTGNINLLC